MTEDAEPTATEKLPATFGGLAKRLRSRTTDLLAIAIILVGGLAVGGKVSQWWQTDDASPGGPVKLVTAGTSDADAPVELDFGHSPFTLNRRILSGERREAVQQLVDVCRQVAVGTSLPTQPPTEAERKLLIALSAEKPVQVDGRQRVYLKDGPVPLAVLTDQTDSDDADRSRRVVCWGAAFPSGDKRWTAYLFYPTETRHKTTSTEATTIPLPPDARPVLTIRGQGTLWRTFRSEKTVADSQRFYINWFTAHGWSETTSTAQNETWTAVYEKKTDDGTWRTEIHIAPDARKTTTGVLLNRNLKTDDSQ